MRKQPLPIIRPFTERLNEREMKVNQNNATFLFTQLSLTKGCDDNGVNGVANDPVVECDFDVLTVDAHNVSVVADVPVVVCDFDVLTVDAHDVSGVADVTIVVCDVDVLIVDVHDVDGVVDVPLIKFDTHDVAAVVVCFMVVDSNCGENFISNVTTFE